jgi:hypothetical protein
MPLPKLEYDLETYLRPSEVARDFFTNNFYRCLPLMAANSLGWTLHNPFAFNVIWRGGNTREGVIIETDHPDWVYSWFGHGTFTIAPQFLVETSPGIDLLIRPVPNHFKLPVLTLEGLVETDWLKSAFTLNFRLMLPLISARYEVGEPLVQLVPYPRAFIENVDARIVTEGPAFQGRQEQFAHWHQERVERVEQKQPPDLNYMRGLDLEGNKVSGHKKTFKVRKFTR